MTSTLTDSPATGSTACGPFVMRWVEHGPPYGPLVLLLHGIYAGAHSNEWRNLIPVLARTYFTPRPHSLGSMAPRLFSISKTPFLAWAMYMFIRT